MADNGAGAAAPRDAWLAFKRVVRRIYLFCGTVALLLCLTAIISTNNGWLNIGWSVPNTTEIAGLVWSAASWLALNSGEVIRVASFALVSWALFIAAMKTETIFNIVRAFNEARSPISQLRTSVEDIKSTITSVKDSARDFDKNMGVLKEFNERFRALSDQIIELQEEAVSQRTDAAPLPGGALDAANADSDEQNWEEFRAIWKRNNQRLQATIDSKLAGARQRKYDNYSRTDYPYIIDRLFEDGALSRTARDKSIDLHKMFMSYKSRRKPVTEEVVANARILDKQLGRLIDSERAPQDGSAPSDHAALAQASESPQRSNLADASAGNANGRPDRQAGT